MSVPLPFRRLRTDDDDVPLPAYATDGAAGLDVRAAVREPLPIEPGARVAVPTGLAVAVPAGYELQVRPRSGLALKGVTCVNAPGTIDSDYRGEIKVLLGNLGTERHVVLRGDRIAQLVLAPVVRADVVLEDALDETPRGSGGFGSTGR